MELNQRCKSYCLNRTRVNTDDHLPINNRKIRTDSRSVTLPHQSEGIAAMTQYFSLEKDIPIDLVLVLGCRCRV